MWLWRAQILPLVSPKFRFLTACIAELCPSFCPKAVIVGCFGESAGSILIGWKSPVGPPFSALFCAIQPWTPGSNVLKLAWSNVFFSPADLNEKKQLHGWNLSALLPKWFSRPSFSTGWYLWQWTSDMMKMSQIDSLMDRVMLHGSPVHFSFKENKKIIKDPFPHLSVIAYSTQGHF